MRFKEGAVSITKIEGEREASANVGVAACYHPKTLAKIINEGS